MKTSHTPGPWISTRVPFRYGCYGHRIVRDNGSIADRDVTLASIGTDSDEDRANARLIAAAPELLATAAELLRAHDAQYGKLIAGSTAFADAYLALHNAIAKATQP